MTIQPLSVCVIVPVYNGEKTIAACLESLLQQQFNAGPFEIIVVENGSTDRTQAIVQTYPVRIIQCERKGPAYARNVGARHTQADILAFTDADCVADPDWLEELVQPFSDEEIGGCGGRIEAALDANSTFAEFFCQKRNTLNNYISGVHEYLPHLYTANAAYRRDVFERVGGFNANLLTAEDVDLSWRVQIAGGARIGYADRAVIYHHHRSTMKALTRQYRQYGFGEILVDTLYREAPGYPRTPGYQMRQIFRQVMALPRYLLSMGVRRVKRWMNRADAYAVAEPEINLQVEWSNIRGKILGLWATRGMRTVEHVFQLDPQQMIDQFYGKAVKRGIH